MAESRVEYYCRRHEALLQQKNPWNVLFQSVSELFLTRKRDFTASIAPGEFLQDDVFNNTGQHSGFLLASVLDSMIWPDASRAMTLEPVRKLKGFPGVDTWFAEVVTPDLQLTMDAPRAGMSLARMEHFVDTAVFGTSGIATFENPDSDDEEVPALFEAWDVKSMCIAENAQGYVVEVYYLESLTVRQVVERYGESGRGKVSPKVLKLYAEAKFDEKVEVLTVVEPKKADKSRKGRAAMKTRTVHLDKTNKFFMRESGFREAPVAVGRMFKTKGEPYGRSSGTMTLPDMISLNVLSEAILVATGKKLDPPLAVMDNGRLGGGVINTSEGAINVFNSSGRIDSSPPVFPLYTVEDLQQAKDQKEELKLAVTQGFFLDRLLDFNTQQQMTAFETSVRNRIRGEATGSILSRQITEVFTPTIHRSFNISYRRGRFGEVPGDTGEMRSGQRKWTEILGGRGRRPVVPPVVAQAIAADLQVFTINYISPAQRFLQGEKMQGLITASDILLSLDVLFPGIKDNVDPDKLAAAVFRYSGAPPEMVRNEESRDALREAINSQNDVSEGLGAAREASEITRNLAQARATIGTAPTSRPAGGSGAGR